MHFVIVRASHNVGGNLGKCAGRCVETTGLGASVLITTYTVAVVEWGDDAWELERGLDTILERVHI